MPIIPLTNMVRIPALNALPKLIKLPASFLVSLTARKIKTSDASTEIQPNGFAVGPLSNSDTYMIRVQTTENNPAKRPYFKNGFIKRFFNCF